MSTELPKRTPTDLARDLRTRAGYLDREHWETPATVAMMLEAADALAAAHAARAELAKLNGQA